MEVTDVTVPTSDETSDDRMATAMADKQPVAESAVSVETPSRLQQANKLVRNYAIAATPIGLIPTPALDLVVLSGLQLKLLHSLAKLYEVKFSKEIGKSIITALLGGSVSTSGATSMNLIAGASFAKTLPVAGTATGMASMAMLGGATTYGIGKVFIQHFESGGTFLNFDPEAVREHFLTEFQKGKTVVAG